MSDELNLEGLFEGLDETQIREVVSSMKKTAESFKQPAQPNYDEAEAAEIAAISVRGENYALQKRNIKAKYSQLRNQPAPEVDEEIQKAGDDPRALMQLYKSRIATIRPGDPLALRKRTEIASPFRAKGLNV